MPKKHNAKSNALQLFHSAPVPQAVLKNTLPAMAAMLMVLVYNLADTFFIGQTNDDLQVAAVSLATPVFLLFMALGTVLAWAEPPSSRAHWDSDGHTTPKES
ncbi:MAG: MATE family efflux transporter, partial [Firmicutes bacterium]|nr:MATE family efflux transporter [Bacillota bacterium]